MDVHKLEAVLSAHPLFHTLGLRVAAAVPGSVSLRIPRTPSVAAYGGNTASGALYAAAELASTVLVGGHPDLQGCLLQSGRIRYFGPAAGDLTASASVADEAIRQAREEKQPLEVVVLVVDEPGAQVAEARFRFGGGQP